MNGNAIEAARKRFGMDRTELGAAVGVSERTIYRWERGDVTISKPSQKVLVGVFDRARQKKRAQQKGK